MIHSYNLCAAFQAEYEGSIPSTRSRFFNNLATESDFILTALGIGFAERGLFTEAQIREPHRPRAHPPVSPAPARVESGSEAKAASVFQGNFLSPLR